MRQPVYIQRSRKHKQISPNGLNIKYCGRGSKYGNPYAVAQYGIDEALRLFEIYLDKHPEIVEAAKKELKGCNLSCWCAPDAPCHTRIIAQRAGLNVSFEPIKNK